MQLFTKQFGPKVKMVVSAIAEHNRALWRVSAECKGRGGAHLPAVSLIQKNGQERVKGPLQYIYYTFWSYRFYGGL